MVFEQLATTNLGAGAIFIKLLSAVFYIVIVGGLAAFMGVLLFILFRYLSYYIDVELWEKIGDNDLQYLGDDRARKVSKKGVSYIGFLRNKTESFKLVDFPDNKYFIKKRFFGKKIKYIVSGDNLIPCTDFKLSKNNGIEITGIPNYVKRDHLTRLEILNEEFNKKSQGVSPFTYVIGVGLITIVLVGFFVIWQSNVATAEATQALASSLSSFTAPVNTLPSSPT